MSKTALVFGASGNSGTYVIKRLTHNGWDVIGVSRKHPNFQSTKYKHISLDLRKDSLNSLPKDVDLIINLAGLQPSILDKQLSDSFELQNLAYIETNILANLRLIEFSVTTRARTFVFASTHRELENLWSNGVSVPSDSLASINTTGDHAMFAITKSAAAQVNQFVAANGPVRAFNFRLPMMLLVPDSPYYLRNGEPTIMPFLELIRRASFGEQIEIWGDPDLRRDYVHIENFFQLTMLAHASSVAGGTFVVGTGEGVRTKDFVQLIVDTFSRGTASEIVENPAIKTYKSAMYDTSRESELLGYRPLMLKECLEMLKGEMHRAGSFQKCGWES